MPHWLTQTILSSIGLALMAGIWWWKGRLASSGNASPAYRPSMPPIRTPPPVAAGPVPWYSRLALLGIALTPFVQYYAYLHYRTGQAFFLPLAACLAVLFVTEMIAPRSSPADPAMRRSRLSMIFVMALTVLASFLIPLEAQAGAVLVVRAIIIDLLALVMVGQLVETLRGPAMKRA